ncbi:unnamed protein product, partial [Darwinula stevensoni]
MTSVLGEMGLWTDKHRPKTLTKLDYHKEQAEQLRKLVHGGDFPHLLVYGPPGAGKKTRIHCLLRELYGPSIEHLRLEKQEFTTPSKKRLEIIAIGSNYHIEVNPSDVGIHDRVVIQEVLKNTAQTHQLDSVSQKQFKVVVLDEVDKLTKDAQHALRRTMEKYMATCRLILCCNSSSKVIPAIRSRCLPIRVPAPSQEDIIRILQNVCKSEGLNLPTEFAKKITEKSNRNLRRALLMCQACKTKQYPFSTNQEVIEPEWEAFLKKTADLILEEQSPSRLMTVRNNLYELLSHCIPTNVIFKGLLKHLVRNIDGALKIQVTEQAAFYEHRLNVGDTEIFHLEAFVAKFMSIYSKFLEENMAAFGGFLELLKPHL